MMDGELVGYQGVEGANSHEAALACFGVNAQFRSFLTFEDAFIGLMNQEVQRIVLPIENSCTGSISQVYDLLTQYNCFIVGEKKVRIRHHLMGLKGTLMSNIETVYSHVQGFEQCSRFFKAHTFKHLMPYYNTAYSAKHVAETMDPTCAAVASLRAADLYGLEIIKSDIQDHLENHTRFVVIGRQMEEKYTFNKVTLMFTAMHVPGALYSALKVFNDFQMNVLKIESRPIISKPWEYSFYIDVEGSDKMAKALEQLESNCVFFKVIGCYNSEDYHQSR